MVWFKDGERVSNKGYGWGGRGEGGGLQWCDANGVTGYPLMVWFKRGERG